MPRNDAIQVSVYDVIHAGLMSGIRPAEALAQWRSIGGTIRDQAFYIKWDAEKEALRQYLESRRRRGI